MCIQCAICGEKRLIKEGRSLCGNCGDAIRRLLWVAAENPEWYSPAPAAADNPDAVDLAPVPQDPAGKFLARLGWSLRFD
jgi:hypothetical protein